MNSGDRYAWSINGFYLNGVFGGFVCDFSRCEVEVAVSAGPDGDDVRDIGLRRYPVDVRRQLTADYLEHFRVETIVNQRHVHSGRGADVEQRYLFSTCFETSSLAIAGSSSAVTAVAMMRIKDSSFALIVPEK
ncbi:hypothetical protein SFRURICE_018567 [Spodoptera frugiperda]|nr:hypothetical protein SFRURICE_018567 [Spodoptera frugiperda]